LKVLLDTHYWIWWLTPQSPLREAERAAIDRSAERVELYVAAVSLWEAQMLHTKQRLELPISFAEWLSRAADPAMISVLPLDVDVVLALDELPESFHGDPADRLIVATARAHGMPLATRDRNIRKSRTTRLWKPASHPKP